MGDRKDNMGENDTQTMAEHLAGTDKRCSSTIIREWLQQRLQEATHPDFYDNMDNMEIKK